MTLHVSIKEFYSAGKNGEPTSDREDRVMCLREVLTERTWWRGKSDGHTDDPEIPFQVASRLEPRQDAMLGGSTCIACGEATTQDFDISGEDAGVDCEFPLCDACETEFYSDSPRPNEEGEELDDVSAARFLKEAERVRELIEDHTVDYELLNELRIPYGQTIGFSTALSVWKLIDSTDAPSRAAPDNDLRGTYRGRRDLTDREAELLHRYGTDEEIARLDR